MTSAAYIAALKTLLEARPGLAGVAVHLTADSDVVAPAILLVRSRITQETEWFSMGPKRTVTSTIPGMVYTTAGTMQAAADALDVILTEIGSAITPALPAVGANMRKAELAEVAWQPFQSDKGGWIADAEFSIVYQTDLA